MTGLFKKAFQALGYDVIRYPHFSDVQRLQLFRRFDINTIVDVGANEGQYASYMWNNGFAGTIISFEPVLSTYRKLELNAKGNKAWVTKNVAVGDKSGEAIINVTENTLSSSLLSPLEGFLGSTPEARVVRKDKVQVVTLDSLDTEIAEYKKNVFLKIDSQGYEKKILEGGENCLPAYKGIQVELSLQQMYEGEDVFLELFPALLAKGFKLHVIENGYCDPTTGEVLQIELILFRHN